MAHTNFPGVIGAIDCTHVAIITPTEEEHNYVNRKGYHSKNVQVICDYNLKILNINPQFPGSTHDLYIWRMSQAKVQLERCFNDGDRNSWLLGDSGYPQQPWLMIPVLNAAVGTHRSARNCIERCFGLLKGRFRCLLGERTLRYSPERVGTIVVSCAALHNICIAGRLEDNNLNIADVPDGHNIDVFHDNHEQHDDDGRELEEDLLKDILSKTTCGTGNKSLGDFKNAEQLLIVDDSTLLFWSLRDDATFKPEGPG
ncbi:hypothetical protein NQ318_009143 [Aromia moschata]|uniref:Putative nuclease HARBI1 n=1 Tax=Aromia moschata TaxID=1265417 RepID=A0AAV8XGT0_9CUCU|nr:hypothetical protein NQ318_009143 [Aromia moschata]